jgi:hypothetical protein
MTSSRIILCSFFTSMIALSFISSGFAQSLTLTVETSRSAYDLGDPTIISGNLTLGDSPVADGLVAVQVLDPRDETMALRTLNTGTDPPRPWVIEIIDFYTCDLSGEIQTSFPRGGVVGFTIQIKNHALSSHKVLAPIYIQYSNGIPCRTFILYNSTIDGGNTDSSTTYIPIPDSAPVGPTYAYASVLTEYPSEYGYAYSPERETTFETTIQGGAAGAMSEQLAYMEGGGSFSMSFKTNPYGGLLGNYSIYAISQYWPYIVRNQTTFQTMLTGDITGAGGVPDGKIDVRDVSRVARAYGSRPGSSNWDPICDLNKDGKVDVRDVAGCARNYGKYGKLP